MLIYKERGDGDLETLTLLLFCAALVVCVALNWSILYALVVGLAIFLAYGRRRGYGWRELGKMCLDGVKTSRNILITFLLIGVLTALWRAAGTIPAIISYTTPFIRPSVFLLMTFLLNCLVSVLTGTSFHYGRHLRHSWGSHGGSHRSGGGCSALRRVFRRPVLSGVYQRPAGLRAHPNQHF
mgnify:CR=1 FL=1